MFVRFLVALVFAATLGVATSGPACASVGRVERLIYRGFSLPAARATFRTPRAELPASLERERLRPALLQPARRPQRRPGAAFGAAAPVVVGEPVVAAGTGFFGFAGLSHLDQFNAGTGTYANTQLKVEPPDQALCAANGFVVEAVNSAAAIYSSAGKPLTAPTPLSQLFREPPEISANLGYGPSLSSPRCLFDRDTQRWFLSVAEIDETPQGGTFAGHSSILLAVSKTADPTAGYSIYALDTTDAEVRGCPCYDEHPLLGADANGLFISADQFVTFPVIGQGQAGGAQVYALAKAEFARGVSPPVVHVAAGNLPTPAGTFGPWTWLQPAVAPDTSATAGTLDGTEYLLSAVDLNGTGDNHLAVWALTNTQSLAAAVPNVDLQYVVIASEAYTPPPAAVQRAGPAPLAASLRVPLEQIATGSDTISQVSFAGGALWSALTTGVRSADALAAGIAYFAVKPAFDGTGTLSASVSRQGYVAVAGQNVWDPSVGVNAGGGVLLAATLSGPGYYPSAVFVTPDGRVHLAGPGTAPDDGYSGYPPFDGFGVGSWGTNSIAVTDLDGSLWIATEYIAGGRTALANWGTFIGHVQIHG